MKAHERAKQLIAWLRRHEPATIAQIVASGMMERREAAQTVIYCERFGVVERLGIPSGMRERPRYRLTGRDLPAPKSTAAAHSFDNLLSAWGIGGSSDTKSSRRPRKA